jgi:hypothetical protein
MIKSRVAIVDIPSESRGHCPFGVTFLLAWLLSTAARAMEPAIQIETTSPTTARLTWSDGGFSLQSSRNLKDWTMEPDASPGQPFNFSLEPRRPRIIPVMRHATQIGIEALGLWYSTDGYHYAELYPGDLYTGTPGNNVRDPSLLLRPEGWFVAYTAGTFGLTSHWGLAKSQDQGRTWQHVMDVPVTGSITATWGPSFFVDPADGQLLVIISISTGGGNHLAYLQKPLNASLTAWDGGSPMTGALHPSVNGNVFDLRCAATGGFYYLIARSGAQPVIYRATAIAGPWAIFSVPGTQWEANPAQPVEQCQLTHLGGLHWQANFTIPGLVELAVSESFDGMITWTKPVRTVDYSGTVNNHQFSEWVMLSSAWQSQIPPPAAYGEPPGRRFFRLRPAAP